MSAILLRVSAWTRRHWPRLVGAAVLIGLVGGLAMGIAAGTRRTDTAPDRYTREAGGDPDLVITQLSGQPLDEEVAALPGVASMASIVFVPSFLVAPDDGTPVLEPNSFAGDDDAVGARLVEGRYTDPASPNEFTVNRPTAALLRERFGTRVGDRFQIVSYSQDQVAANFDTLDEPAIAPFTGTLVGITESPTEFDDPSPQMVLSRSFLRAHPDVGVVQTIIATRLDDGVDPRAVMDEVRRLPNGGDAYAVPLRVVSESARRAVRFQVTALWLVSALSLLAAGVLIAQVIGRTLRIGDDERESVLAMGWRHRDLAIERAIEGALVAMIAAPLAVVVAYAVTALFPLGVLRAFEPDTGPRMDWGVAGVGLLVITGGIVAISAVVGLRHAPRAAARSYVGGLAGAASARAATMPLSVGARFASTGGRGRSWPSVLAGGVAMAGLVGAAIVGVTLGRVVDRPDRWGVNYDQLFGNPYTSVDTDIVGPILDNPDVVAATGANIGSVTINGSDTATLGFDSAKGGLVPTVLDGRAPVTPDEIGLGAEVLRRLGVHVGDAVEVVGASGEPRQVVVVGKVVTPDSAGNGAAMTFDGYRTVNPTATENVVLVDFRPGTSTSAIDAVAAVNYSPPGALVTPTSVRALERVTAAPFLLGVVLALLLIVGCGYLLATSVRGRRRDLAILRALGSNGRQLRAVVHWQASLVAATIMLIGVPLGIVAGRWVVTLLTQALGIVPGAHVPLSVVVGVTAAALIVANVLALLPGRRAAQAGIAQLSLDR